MVRQIIHNATVTLQLSFYLSIKERVAALRAAGIPVDSMGNATSGYLFVRTTGRVGRRKNTYRWFAAGIGEESPVTRPSPIPVRVSDEEAADTTEGSGGIHLSGMDVPEQVSTTVMYLRLWKQLEQRSREAATTLHKKQIAYLRDLGPPPDALDSELTKEATAAASRCLNAAKDQHRLPTFHDGRFQAGDCPGFSK